MVALAIFFVYAPAIAQPRDGISLPEAISWALQNNNQVMIAQRETDAASARILQAGRIPNPEIELSWGEAPSFLDLGKADELDVTFRQDIEFPTRRNSRIDVAEHDMRIAGLRLERSRTIVTSMVRKGYYGIILFQSAVQSLQGQSALIQDFLDLAENRLATGTGSYLDVIRIKVERTRLGNEILEAEREGREKSRSLNILLGREHDAPLTLTDSLERLPGPLNRDSLMYELPAGSSLLEAARASVERQRSWGDLARSGYLPDFSISLSSQSRSGQPPFNANSYAGTTTRGVGLSFAVSVPLWFWQEPAGQVNEAAALSAIAEGDHVSTRRRVLSSVSAALDMVEAAENQLTVFDGSLLADLEDIMSTAADQYGNDRIDMMNLLDVYRTYRAALVEYNRALLHYWDSRADLDASAELPLSNVND